MNTQMFRVFTLRAYGNQQHLEYVILTPHPESQQKVSAAWAYAVRYTAKGLDLPDHEAAIEMLKQRHPSWEILKTKVAPIAVNLAHADQDEPEVT